MVTKEIKSILFIILSIFLVIPLVLVGLSSNEVSAEGLSDFQWTGLADLPFSPVGELYFSPITEDLSEGQVVYIIDQGTNFYRYNVFSDNYTPLASPNKSASYMPRHLVPDDMEFSTKLYCVSDDNYISIYDISTDTWTDSIICPLVDTQLSGTPSGSFIHGEMVTGVDSGAIGWYESQDVNCIMIYPATDIEFQVGEQVIGGTSGENLTISAINSPGGRYILKSFVYKDPAEIYVWAGRSSGDYGNCDQGRLIKYDPSEDTWTVFSLNQIGPSVDFSVWNAAINPEGTVIYAGGINTGNYYKYDLSTDTYSYGGNLTSGRNFARAYSPYKLWYYSSDTCQQGYIDTSDDSEHDEIFVENIDRSPGYGRNFAVSGTGMDIIAHSRDTTPRLMSCWSPPKPVATFVLTPSEPKAGDNITFDASSLSGMIESYHWDFGDNTTGEGQVVTHSYPNIGDYLVSLSVTDIFGNTDNTSKIFSVVLEDPPTFTKILRPNASGNLSTLYTYPSDGIHWNKVSEEVSDNDLTYVHRYSGTTSTSYDSYNLDDMGISSNATITNVRVVAKVRRIAMNPSGYYPTTIGLGLWIDGHKYYKNADVSSNSYVTISTDYPKNPYTGNIWTVDEIDSLQSCLSLSFINVFLYKGGLISGRCTQLYVEVTYSPANFTWSPEYPSVGDNIEFDASSSIGEIISYEWDFGDETTGVGRVVNHTYQNQGDYPVNLTITYASGENSTISKTIGVTYNPPGQLTLRPNGRGDLQQIDHAQPDVDHWLNIDDVISDDSATRIYTYYKYFRSDLYTVTPYTGSNNISQITLYAKVRTSGWYPESHYPYLLIKINGTVYQYLKSNYPNENWVTVSQTFTTNPATGLPWTPFDINSMQIGIKLGGDWGYRRDCCGSCSQLYAVVEYEEAVDLMLGTKDISIFGGEWVPSGSYDIYVKVRNAGPFDVEDDVVVEFLRTDANDEAYETEYFTISNTIEAGTSEIAHINMVLDPTDKILITIDPHNAINEYNEQNNTACTTQMTGQVTDNASNPLAHLPVEYEQLGTDLVWRKRITTYTDEQGYYCIPNNWNAISENGTGRIKANLMYCPKNNYDSEFKIIDESVWGDGNDPKDKTPVSKLSDQWVMNKDSNNHTVETIVFEGDEGGTAYSTFMTLYSYHQSINQEPHNQVLVEINDDDHDAKRIGYYIYLPTGEDGTTRPSVMGHEYTHIVEIGWRITNIFSHGGHDTDYPVHEGSCHWGSCVARGSPKYVYPDGEDPNEPYVTINISNINETCNNPFLPPDTDYGRAEFQIAGTMWDLDWGLVWHTLRFGAHWWTWDVPDSPELFYSDYKEHDPRLSPLIKGIFQAHGYETANWTGKDGLDPDFFTGNYSDSPIDDNGDGIAEYLDIDVEVNIEDAGYYYLNGELTGSSTGATTYSYLNTGIQTISLRFYGEWIFETGQDGPYTLSVFLAAEDYTRIDLRLDAYQTSPYEYTDFSRPALLYSGNFSEYGDDTDNDGLYDFLVINADVDAIETGTYEIAAYLYSLDGSYIAEAMDSFNLDAGLNTIQLAFKGKAIYASGLDGPYGIALSIPFGQDITSSLYSYDEFQRTGAVLQTLVYESGEDTNGDTFYDELKVEAAVDCILPGSYLLSGHLYDNSANHITSTSNSYELSPGTHVVQISFGGGDIREELRDGEYNVVLELTDDEDIVISRISENISYYSYTDFQPLPEELFNITLNDYGSDTDSDGLYDYLTIDVGISSDFKVGNYWLSGILFDSNGNRVTSIKSLAYVYASLSDISLDFSGIDIWKEQDEAGVYTLLLQIFNEEKILLIEYPDLYATFSYSSNEFETPVVYLTDSFSDYGVDTNGDGQYEYLAIEVGTSVTVAGEYTLVGILNGHQSIVPGEEFIRQLGLATEKAYYDTGNHSIVLYFEGSAIYKQGISGQYTLSMMLREGANLLDSQLSAYSTSSYEYTDFEHSSVMLTGHYSDYGKDNDGDGSYEYLAVEVGAIVADAGNYQLSATLTDIDGDVAGEATVTKWLLAGQPQVITLDFDSSDFYGMCTGDSIQFNVRNVSIFNTDNVSQADFILDAYWTSAYRCGVFSDNQPPVADAGPDQTIQWTTPEGAEITLDGSGSCDPDGDPLVYEWRWSDISMSGVAPKVLLPVGTTTVTLEASDGIMTATDTVVITISINQPPIVDADLDQIVDIDDEVTFSGSFTDSDSDNFTIKWFFGDGGQVSGILTPTHTYTESGEYNVLLVVRDNHGNSGCDAVTITVREPAPIAAFTWSPDPQDEGFEVQFTDNSTSATNEIVGWYWNFGSSGNSSEQHPVFTFQDDGLYEVSLTVTDNEGYTGSVNQTVSINNVAPIVTAGGATIYENEIATVGGTITDPGTQDSFEIVIQWGEDTPQTYSYPAGSTSYSESHQYLDDNPSGTESDDYAINITVTDDDGGEGTANTTVTVNNVAPTVSEITAPLDPVQLGAQISASATFTDLGAEDTHTATWNWGDNTTSEGYIDLITGSISGNHTYTMTGVYTVILTVTDDDNGSAESVFRYVVIYNPEGGFVTGGGWINSPDGAYMDDPLLTGKANFSFVCKYQQGGGVPTGEIQFNFKEADLKLHSTGYEWLVINGAKAIFRGQGIINGEGNYGLIITVIDDDLTPDTDIDLFRIKIWDIDTSAVVYDTQMGDEENADPVTELGGGSIVIHEV